MSSRTEPQAEGGPLRNKVLGFMGFGLAVRALQLGIQGAPLRFAPRVYLYNAAGWGAVGYWWYHAEVKQKQLLFRAEQHLEKAREKEHQALSSSSLGNALPQ